MSTCKTCGDTYGYSPIDELCRDCRKELPLTLERVNHLLSSYECLCDHAGDIATAYILATEKDKGQVERYGFDFEFPDSHTDDTTFSVAWTETWAYGGLEHHRHSIPFHLVLMDKEEALAEIQAIKEAKEREKEEAKEKKKQAEAARERATYEKLQAKYGGSQ